MPLNPTRIAPRVFFSIACLFALSLIATAQACADGFTITITDNGDMPIAPPSLTITGTSSAASVTFENCATNGCAIGLTPNPGFTATSIPANFYLNLPGNPVVADWYQFVKLSNGQVSIGFANLPPADPLCSDNVCVPITGAPITVGQITWTFLGDPVTDTIRFQTAPGSGGTVPEPSSLLLVLGGLAAIATLFRRS